LFEYYTLNGIDYFVGGKLGEGEEDFPPLELELLPSLPEGNTEEREDVA